MVIIAVIISLSILILAHELGHFAAAKLFNVKVEEFGFGYPPRIFSRKIGETTYSINLLPLGGFVHILGEDEEQERSAAIEKGENTSMDTSRYFSRQSLPRRIIILIAGVAMNVLTGWLLFSAVYMVGSPSHLMISNVAQASPAAEAGLRMNDIIVRAQVGSEIFSDPISNKEFIPAVKKAAGSIVVLDVERAGERMTFSVPTRTNPPKGQGAMGVSLDEIGIEKQPFFTAIGNGFIASMSVFWTIAKGFGSIISGLFTAPSAALQGVAGPVGIFNLAAQTGKMGFVYLFQLIALISMNLAVLNLIPFPALDGGRVLFIIIEKLKGSPVPQRTQRIVNAIGFSALMLLMIIVTVHDITNLSR